MNIFILDEDPEIAATYYCDKHVVKIILECYQMMGSAARRNGAVDDQMPLTKSGKPLIGGYKNHPVTIWVGDCLENYLWTYKHAQALCSEYTHRYGRVHFCRQGICRLKDLRTELNFRKNCGKTTNFAQAMPKDLIEDDPVKSYRRYYNEVKAREIKMVWTKRQKPTWFTG